MGLRVAQMYSTNGAMQRSRDKRAATMSQRHALGARQEYLPNIADSEVLNEVSQIVLKIDFVCVIEGVSPPPHNSARARP
jgi:hypothetical protein